MKNFYENLLCYVFFSSKILQKHLENTTCIACISCSQLKPIGKCLLRLALYKQVMAKVNTFPGMPQTLGRNTVWHSLHPDLLMPLRTDWPARCEWLTSQVRVSRERIDCVWVNEVVPTPLQGFDGALNLKTDNTHCKVKCSHYLTLSHTVPYSP